MVHDTSARRIALALLLMAGGGRALHAQTPSGTVTYSASINGSAGLGMVPMRGGEGSPASQFAALLSVGADPNAASQGGFLQNMPLGTLLPGVGPCADGICLISLEEKAAQPSAGGGYELETTRTLGISPQTPIPFGGSGSYEAMVVGCAAQTCHSGVNMGKATVRVLRFDDDVLHLDVSGSYCAFTSLSSITCPQPVSFQAEIIKPFGWAYDGARTFHSIDTPGMQEYREYTSKALSGIVPGVTAWRRPQGQAPAGSGPATATPPAPAGGNTSTLAPQTCDCSCAGYRKLMADLDAYQKAVQSAAAAGARSPTPPPAMQAMTTCTIRCAIQWGSCQTPPP